MEYKKNNIVQDINTIVYNIEHRSPILNMRDIETETIIRTGNNIRSKAKSSIFKNEMEHQFDYISPEIQQVYGNYDLTKGISTRLSNREIKKNLSI